MGSCQLTLPTNCKALEQKATCSFLMSSGCSHVFSVHDVSFEASQDFKDETMKVLHPNNKRLDIIGAQQDELSKGCASTVQHRSCLYWGWKTLGLRF